MNDAASFFSSGFMPHGHCYLWTPSILWTHVVSDVLIAVAYYSIPMALLTFLRRRRDVAFGSIFVLFGAFIFACGTTHLLSIWTTWSAGYGIEGVAKAATALLSLLTAGVLWWKLPNLVALPSPADLASANAQLAGEVEQRRCAEAELLELNAELEARVRERTTELSDRAAELERSNYDLEQFAYVVSHDLKTPLRGITHLADWLAEDHADGLDAEGLEQLKLLRERVARMHQLVEGVLAFSRAGGRPRFAPVSVADVLREVGDTLMLPSQVTLEVAGPLPEVVYDRAQLGQILQNLISNAARALGPSGGRIGVAARAIEGGHEIRISDSGPGIAPEHNERIFRMFQTLSREKETTGIGLSIVKRIVERRGGSVWVESAPGQGATFAFTIAGAPDGSAPVSPDPDAKR